MKNKLFVTTMLLKVNYDKNLIEHAKITERITYFCFVLGSNCLCIVYQCMCFVQTYTHINTFTIYFKLHILFVRMFRFVPNVSFNSLLRLFNCETSFTMPIILIGSMNVLPYSCLLNQFSSQTTHSH